MKRWLPIPVLALAALAAVAAPAPQQMSVQVRSGQVRATASFLGRIVADLPYGTRVEIVQPSKPWMQVRTAAGQAGWMHESALSSARLQLKAGAGDAQAGTSASEVSLAAKGFTQQVEKEYRSKNPALDFAWVDRMEAFRVTAPESEAFLAAGQVAPKEGGAR